jgi:hypothetical protein
MSAELNRKHEDFIHRLVAIKEEAGRLGFYRTMHALDGAVQEIGWEVASHRDPAQRKLGDKYKEVRA